MFGIEEIKNGCLNINGTTNVINGSWEITMPDYMQKEQGVDLFMASLGKSPCPTGCTWEITCSDCLDQRVFMASLKMENNCNIFPLLQNSVYKLSVTEKKPRPDPGVDKKKHPVGYSVPLWHGTQTRYRGSTNQCNKNV